MDIIQQIHIQFRLRGCDDVLEVSNPKYPQKPAGLYHLLCDAYLDCGIDVRISGTGIFIRCSCYGRKYVDSATGILLMSALVAFMSSFVIGYAIRFMLGRRKKEFATYELIGMEAKTVRDLFLAENSIIGTGAFLLGSLVGTGLSGLLNQVVKNIFEVPHPYRVSFSLRAWAVTFLFFALMYGLGMLRAAKIICHQKKDYLPSKSDRSAV